MRHINDKQFTDGGEPPLSNLATVNITVTDCNDNAPVFTQVSYSTRISENAPVDAKVIEVNYFYLAVFEWIFIDDFCRLPLQIWIVTKMDE